MAIGDKLEALKSGLNARRGADLEQDLDQRLAQLSDSPLKPKEKAQSGPEVSLEKIEETKEVLNKAYVKIRDEIYPVLVRQAHTPELRNGVLILKKFLAEDFVFDPVDYISLMYKESDLDPNAVSRSGAKGLFQIMSSAQAEVKKYYNYTATDIMDPVENAVIGLLYLHRCRYHYAEQVVFEGLSNDDKQLLSYAIYNKGYSRIKKIWERHDFQTFADFETYVSDAICSQLGFSHADRWEDSYDARYQVNYRKYQGITAYENSSSSDILKIDGVDSGFTIPEAVEMLKYSRMIEALDESGFHRIGKYEYTVKEGQTLTDIAGLCACDLELIKQMNGIESNADLKPGMVILTPNLIEDQVETVLVDGIAAASEAYGLSPDYIAKLSGIEAFYGIRRGETLRIPATLDYTVLKGDTLYRIASRYSEHPMEMVSKIKQVNGLVSNNIEPGQFLHIPTANSPKYIIFRPRDFDLGKKDRNMEDLYSLRAVAEYYNLDLKYLADFNQIQGRYDLKDKEEQSLEVAIADLEEDGLTRKQRRQLRKEFRKNQKEELQGNAIVVDSEKMIEAATKYFYNPRWIEVTPSRGFYSSLVLDEKYSQYLTDVVSLDLKGNRYLVTEVIIDFNRRFNPELKELNDEASNIPLGAKIWIPNVEYYVEYFEGGLERPIARRAVRTQPTALEELLKSPELTPDDEGQYVKYENGRWVRDFVAILEGSEPFPVTEWNDHPEWDDNYLSTRMLFNGNIGLDDVEYIILHSTAGRDWEDAYVGPGKAKSHFVVDRDGTIYYLIDLGAEGKYKIAPHAGRSIWNGVQDLNQYSIGIEVVALANQDWSEEQREAVGDLVYWLGGRYGLKKSAVLRHSDIAYSKYGRGRKSDPYDDPAELFESLSLPNNSRLLDTDVASGRVPKDTSGIEKSPYHDGVWQGLEAAQSLRK